MDGRHNANSSHETALIVEGGAMRSVFSVGLLDGFLKKNFNPFDFYIGVSAGAGNLAAYLSRAPRMNLDVYLNGVIGNDFINYWRFLRGGHLIDLDWLFARTFSQPSLDVPAIFAQGRPFYVGLTDVASGEAAYARTSPDNLANVIKASTALPLFYRGFPEVEGRPMSDGGVADGIPVREAIRLGAKRIMVVLSRSDTYRKKDTPVHRYIRWKLRRQPQLVATMRERIERHEEVKEIMRRPPPGVSIVVVCPPAHFNVGRFCRDRDSLLQGYRIGFDMAETVISRWLELTAFRESPQITACD